MSVIDSVNGIIIRSLRDVANQSVDRGLGDGELRVIVLGGPQSGKTTLLATIANHLAKACPQVPIVFNTEFDNARDIAHVIEDIGHRGISSTHPPRVSVIQLFEAQAHRNGTIRHRDYCGSKVIAETEKSPPSSNITGMEAAMRRLSRLLHGRAMATWRIDESRETTVVTVIDLDGDRDRLEVSITDYFVHYAVDGWSIAIDDIVDQWKHRPLKHPPLQDVGSDPADKL